MFLTCFKRVNRKSQPLWRKHIRQMLRKCEIIEGGESNYLKGEIIERARVIDECAKLEAEGKELLSLSQYC